MLSPVHPSVRLSVRLSHGWACKHFNPKLAKILPGQNDSFARLCRGYRGIFPVAPVKLAPMHAIQ